MKTSRKLAAIKAAEELRLYDIEHPEELAAMTVKEVWLAPDGRSAIADGAARPDDAIRVVFSTRALRFHSGDYLTSDEKFTHAYAHPAVRTITLVDNWFDLEHELREFMLAHEIGHIICGHFITESTVEILTRRNSYSYRNKVMPEELEADAHAVKILGKAIVIEGMRQLMCKDLRLMQWKECILRTVAILKIKSL